MSNGLGEVINVGVPDRIDALELCMQWLEVQSFNGRFISARRIVVPDFLLVVRRAVLRVFVPRSRTLRFPVWLPISRSLVQNLHHPVLVDFAHLLENRP